MSSTTLAKPREKKKLRQQQLDIQFKRRQIEQHVEIPSLTKAQKRRRQQLEEDHEAWIWEMMGPKSGLLEPLTRKFTSHDSDMIGSFFESLNYGGDQLTLASRGGGKTTCLRNCIVKALLDGTLTYGAYFGSTANHAEKTLDQVKYAVSNSIGIATYYPEVAVPTSSVGGTVQRATGMLASGKEYGDGRKVFNKVPIQFKWGMKELLFPRVPGSPSYASIFNVFGLDSAVRGLNTLGRRPDGVFIDDPDTMKTISDPVHRDKLLDRIHLDIGGLRGEGRKMCRLMLCTLSHKGEGVAHYLSGENSPFVIQRHQFLIEPPMRLEMWMKYMEMRKLGKMEGDKFGRKAHKFYLKNRQEMDAGAKVVNKHRFDKTQLPDKSYNEITALQWYFNEWCDKGEEFARCELDNERVVIDRELTTTLTQQHIANNCVGNLERLHVEDSPEVICSGIDIRKTELHWVSLADSTIFEYNVKTHGGQDMHVELAETAILKSLESVGEYIDTHRPVDRHGTEYATHITLIDKGWIGSWKEDGQIKTWATQPVETFCMANGLRRWLPAHGHPNWTAPDIKPGILVGDHWHMNMHQGKNRKCHEIIWDRAHWMQQLEDRFSMDPTVDLAFKLFQPQERTLWKDHSRFAYHQIEGLENFYEVKRHPHKRRHRYRTDHWADGLVMALVAQSVELYFRNSKQHQPRPSLAAMKNRK